MPGGLLLVATQGLWARTLSLAHTPGHLGVLPATPGPSWPPAPCPSASEDSGICRALRWARCVVLVLSLRTPAVSSPGSCPAPSLPQL